MPAPHFSSWNSYAGFSRAVRFQSRFIHDKRVTTFLRAVSASVKRRIATFPDGKALWRAQVGHELESHEQDGVEYEEPIPLSAERMKPRRHSAHEGRVNPRGIPCLYTATAKETAVAEVRPWLGALVSVAQLSPNRSLRLVNCADGGDLRWDLYLDEPAPSIREEAVWRAIGRAYSEPVEPDPGVAEYAPTQVLAEHFKGLGYDGVFYRSTLGKGFNIAIFDMDALDVMDVRLYPVNAVRYEIGEMRSSYVVKRRKLAP